MGLNKEQLQAVNSTSDRILCLAGAGAGKTKTMLDRISRLVNDGAAPSSILALTFTNAAAAEMKSRYEKVHIGSETPEFRTFHSFCYSILCKDVNIRNALGYDSVPQIASEDQERAIDEKARVQCNLTISKEHLAHRDTLTKKELFQAELYDKAINRLMRSENLITFDKLNSEVSELFASGHPATQVYKDQYKYLFADECLPACMSVLTDNGWYTIDRLYRDFVAKNPLPLVKSYNIESAEYEYKPIIGALKSENRDVFEIHTEGLNKIQCTDNHKIYTQRGYVEAKDLVIGQDMVILDSPDRQKTKYLLNSDQYQICLGSYLGDGHVDKMSKFFTYRLQLTQGIKQQDYFLSKIVAFNLDYRIIKSGYTQELSVLATNPTPVFALRNNIFDCVLSDISPLGLAIWYQDDGTLSSGRYPIICTASFSLEEANKLTSMLKTRFNLEAISYKDKKGYTYIRFGRESGIKFLELVSPYMHPSMQYKTPIDISNNVINYDSSYLNIGANFIDKITYIGTDTVYDLTIADNHNFITSKSAHRVDYKTGTIVHNCQDTDPTQFRFLNSFTDVNVFLCGDVLQNIYSFRGTSNEFIKLLVNTPDWDVIKLYTNYRSTNQICEYANKFSKTYADSSYRIEMKGIRDGERVVTKFVDGPSNYNAVNPRDLDDVIKENSKLTGTTAILCRTNREVGFITSYLKKQGIEYTTNRETNNQHLIECALSDTYMLGRLASYLSSDKYGEYLRLASQLKNPNAEWFLTQYGSNAQIKADAKIISKLRILAASSDSMDSKLSQVVSLLGLQSISKPDKSYTGRAFLEYLKDAVNDIKTSELYVGTIHSVKGLEYDNVFVMNVGSYNFKLNNEDEKNLFYVATTRAKNRLYVYRLFE